MNVTPTNNTSCLQIKESKGLKKCQVNRKHLSITCRVKNRPIVKSSLASREKKKRKCKEKAKHLSKTHTKDSGAVQESSRNHARGRGHHSLGPTAAPTAWPARQSLSPGI